MSAGQFAVIDDTIKRGDRVHCRDANGELHWMIALSSVEHGLDFPRVWVCTMADAKLLPNGHSEHELREMGFRSIPWPRDAIVEIQRRRVVRDDR